MAGTRSSNVLRGVLHEIPSDLRAALVANETALALWNDNTPWVATNSSAGSRTPRRSKLENDVFARLKRSWKKKAVLLAGLQTP
jgi:ketosteroid isomerase-like protein